MRSAKVADPLKLYEVCPMTDASLGAGALPRGDPARPARQAAGLRHRHPDGDRHLVRGHRHPRGRLRPASPSRPSGPTRWPGSAPTTSTWPRSTTRSPSRSRSGSRASASPRMGEGWQGRRRRLDLDRRHGRGQPLGRPAVQGPPARGDRRHPGGGHRRAAARHRAGGHPAPRTPRSASRPAAAARARSAPSTSTSASRGLSR